MKRQRVVVLAAAMLCCLALVAFVQPLGGPVPPAARARAQAGVDAEAAVDWWVVSAGGGPATAGDAVIVQDTLGQPVIGPGSGDAVGLGAGYWYGALAIEYDIYLPLVLRNA